MIDPSNITNFSRTKEELEEFLIFCLLVTGKNARTTSRLLEDLLKSIHTGPQPLLFKSSYRPFYFLKRHNETQLKDMLSSAKFGCYNIKAKSLYELVHSGLNLKTCTVEDLEKIHGIGPKTSRFFILHSRDNQQCAVLDVHILKYLSENGHNVPRYTPSNKKKYKEIEAIFLTIAEEKNVSASKLDLDIWNSKRSA